MKKVYSLVVAVLVGIIEVQAASKANANTSLTITMINDGVHTTISTDTWSLSSAAIELPQVIVNTTKLKGTRPNLVLHQIIGYNADSSPIFGINASIGAELFEMQGNQWNLTTQLPIIQKDGPQLFGCNINGLPAGDYILEITDGTITPVLHMMTLVP